MENFLPSVVVTHGHLTNQIGQAHGHLTKQIGQATKCDQAE